MVFVWLRLAARIAGRQAHGLRHRVGRRIRYPAYHAAAHPAGSAASMSALGISNNFAAWSPSSGQHRCVARRGADGPAFRRRRLDRFTKRPLSSDRFPVARGEGESEGLPDYVITFEPVSDISVVAVATAPPTLKRVGTAPVIHDVEAVGLLPWPRKAAVAGEYHILPVDRGLALLPGMGATVSVSEEIAEAILPQHSSDRVRELVAAPTFGLSRARTSSRGCNYKACARFALSTARRRCRCCA